MINILQILQEMHPEIRNLALKYFEYKIILSISVIDCQNYLSLRDGPGSTCVDKTTKIITEFTRKDPFLHLKRAN